MSCSCAASAVGSPDTNTPAEGWIASLDWAPDEVIVSLVLADGSRGDALVDRDLAEWMELALGQIVRVCRSAGDPGLLLVGQRVDGRGNLVGCHVGDRDRLQDAAHVRPQGDPDAL
jgi:hypothetical protein